jgi:hypothetical protein
MPCRSFDLSIAMHRISAEASLKNAQLLVRPSGIADASYQTLLRDGRASDMAAWPLSEGDHADQSNLQQHRRSLSHAETPMGPASRLTSVSCRRSEESEVGTPAANGRPSVDGSHSSTVFLAPDPNRSRSLHGQLALATAATAEEARLARLRNVRLSV